MAGLCVILCISMPFFPVRKNKPAGSQAWEALAARLDFKRAPLNESFLRTVLSLDITVTLDALYSKDLEPDLQLHLCSYRAPRQQFVCLLQFKAVTGIALKASRKLHRVLESLGASASGAAVLALEHDPDFSERITVYARDQERARQLLKAPLRAVLLRALYDRTVSPTFLLGEQHALFSYSQDLGESIQEKQLEPLEGLLLDLLSIYGFLR